MIATQHELDQLLTAFRSAGKRGAARQWARLFGKPATWRDLRLVAGVATGTIVVFLDGDPGHQVLSFVNNAERG